MIECKVCKVEQEKEQFTKDTSLPGGYRLTCKKCKKDRTKLNSRTINGVISYIYTEQKKKAKNSGMKAPTYTKGWLADFCLSSNMFVLSYEAYVNSGYKQELKPKVSKINRAEEYTKDNIQVVNQKDMMPTSIENLKLLTEYCQSQRGLVWKKTTNPNREAGRLLGAVAVATGYRHTEIGNKPYTMHKLVWLYFTGAFPTKFIDHIDGDKANNSIDNLREVTPEESNRNMPRSIANSSGVIGVQWVKHANKWLARINHKKKSVSLGYFSDFNDAVTARKQAEIAYGYHENHGREQ